MRNIKKRYILSVVLWLLIFAGATDMLAQESIKIKVSGEAVLNEILPQNFVYEYPAFTEGRLYMGNDKPYSAKLNINLVSGELHFLDNDGSVKQVDGSDVVRFASIGRDIWFVINRDFAKSLYVHGDSYLLLVRKTVVSNISKETAFGGDSKTSSVQSLSAITTDQYSQQLIPVGDYEFKIRRSYYLYRDGDYYYADLSGFKKFFTKQRDKIVSFIETNNLDLDKESDLITIFKHFATEE